MVLKDTKEKYKKLEEKNIESYLKSYSTPCKCIDGNNNGEGDNNKKKILDYKEAPHYLKFNPYITNGYRNCSKLHECCKSLFWWSNETINIWTHLLGWLFFLSLTIKQDDNFINTFILICFQACMLLSTLYHTFCCTSETSYRRWLTADLLGVSLSLIAIYLSGIYYAFHCDQFWLKFYLFSIIGIFIFAMSMQLVISTDGEERFQWRLLLFSSWAAYGIIPTVHWVFIYSLDSEIVQLLLPKIVLMYLLSGGAFLFYISRFPERFFPGWMNYLGSSHQIWHILIFIALYHWFLTGRTFFNFIQTHPEMDYCEFK